MVNNQPLQQVSTRAVKGRHEKFYGQVLVGDVVVFEDADGWISQEYALLQVEGIKQGLEKDPAAIDKLLDEIKRTGQTPQGTPNPHG